MPTFVLFFVRVLPPDVSGETKRGMHDMTADIEGPFWLSDTKKAGDDTEDTPDDRADESWHQYLILLAPKWQRACVGHASLAPESRAGSSCQS